MVGQIEDLAPADKKLYALRDVTGTVESLPLIASSIMSKKIAEGTDALVLDVKVGGGAFMKTLDDARRLAEAMVAIGNRDGLARAPSSRRWTRRSGARHRQRARSHRGHRDAEGSRARGSPGAVPGAGEPSARQAGLQPDLTAARARAESALASGAGLEKFRQLIERQGGDPAVVDDYGRFPAPARRETLRRLLRATSPESRRRRSAAPRCCSARAARGSTRPSTTAPGSCCGPSRAIGWPPVTRWPTSQVGAHAQVEQALALAASAYASPRLRPRPCRSCSTSRPEATLAVMSNDRSLRFACAGTAFALAVLAYVLQGQVDPRVQALCGIVCFILIIASCSSNLRAVNFRTVAWGIGLQLLLAVFILKFEIFGVRPGYEFFSARRRRW